MLAFTGLEGKIMAESGKDPALGDDWTVISVPVTVPVTPSAAQSIIEFRNALRKRQQTTLSEMDRMPPGCAVALTQAGIKAGFDFQGRITGKVIGWRNGRVKVQKDGLIHGQWYAPGYWRPIPPEAQVYADWLEERGYSEAAKDFRAHWCP